MAIKFANSLGNINRSAILCWASSSTGGTVNSTDIGGLVSVIGDRAALINCPSTAQGADFVGILTRVTPSSGVDASSNPSTSMSGPGIWVTPLQNFDILYADYSTAALASGGGAGTIPMSSDVGKYVFPSTAAGVYPQNLSMNTLSTAGTTDACQFKLLDPGSSDRREVKVMYFRNLYSS